MVLACFFIVKTAAAQPNTTIDLEKHKPDKYKEKLLKSEKTEEKKDWCCKTLFYKYCYSL